MSKRTWFSAAAGPSGTADIAIYDQIGFGGVSSNDFRDTITGLGDIKTINLRLNSPGGDVFDGLAIHNMLARHPATVNVTVDGIAASVASLIAMAGDKVIMPENAMMMIHNPFGAVMGTAADMRDVADALDKIRSGMVTSYARKSGIDADAIIAVMDAETWLTAQEAKDLGFADEVTSSVKVAAKFDLTRFAHPPKGGNDAPPSEATAARAAYDPDGDGDDDALEAIGYIGQAFDSLTDAVGCLTGTGDSDDKPVALALREAITAAIQKGLKVRSANPSAAAQPGSANADGAPGKETEQHKAQAKGDAAPTGRENEMLQISATCELSGFAQMTAEFLRSGKTLLQVQSELRALTAERGRGSSYRDGDISARHPITELGEAGAPWGKTIDRINSRAGVTR